MSTLPAPTPMHNRLLRTATALAVAVLASACATPYHNPVEALPTAWTSTSAHQGDGSTTTTPPSAISRKTVSLDAWWLAFDDPALTRLIELALARNNDLAAAAYKVRNAQLAAGNAWGSRLPNFSGQLSGNGSKQLGGDTAGSTQWQRSYGATLSASWELDLWGKLQAQQREADWEAAATAQDRQATAMALTGTVATTYWQLATTQSKLASQQHSVDVATQTHRIAQVQHQAGAISGLDVAQSQQNLSSQQAQHAALQQQVVELRNALAILFDVPPEELANPHSTVLAPDVLAAIAQPRLPDMAHLPDVPTGVPADVLARRPDLQAAEMRLRGALAHVDATRASYYPAINLTAGVGTSSSVLSNILKNPVATLGAGLVLPFLNIATVQRNVRISRNSYEQAVVTYRQTLYKALADVENALSNRQQLQQQYQHRQQAAREAARAENLTQVRYQAGAVALKAYLDAQESRRSADLQLQDAQLSCLSNLVQLYQALGGRPLQTPDTNPPTSGQNTPATDTRI